MRILLAAAAVAVTAITALAPAAAVQLPAQPAMQQAGAPLPLNVGGRVIAEADGALGFGWPGTYFEGRFRGTGVRVRFEAPAEYMRLTVDGAEKAVFRRPGSVDHVVEGLAPGEHVVRLEKMTESQSGGGRFIGFFPLAGGAALAPAPRPRRIEYIGDSYTVGYGNTHEGRTCTRTEVHDTTDTQQAFGPLAARRLGADYRIEAYSGFGVVRNYNGGSPALSLPAIYPRLKPDDAAHIAPADDAWHPQVIVINLGTNDFSTPLNAGERWGSQEALREDYRRTYAGFVQGLQRRDPQARFILMGSDMFFADVEQVAATLNAEAPGRVTTLQFGGLDMQGCDYHPSLADHRRLSVSVEEAIRSVLAERAGERG